MMKQGELVQGDLNTFFFCSCLRFNNDCLIFYMFGLLNICWCLRFYNCSLFRLNKTGQSDFLDEIQRYNNESVRRCFGQCFHKASKNNNSDFEW